MKLKYFASAIMAMALAGCSNNEDVLDNNQQEGNSTAYIRVNIAYANGSMGSRGESDGYKDGDNDYSENAIKTSDFYFYDENGNFYKKVSKGALTAASLAPADDNIELLANPVLVLENTINRTTPRKMLVVLNSKTDLSGMTLAKAATTLAQINESDEEVDSKENGFIMTNTTYWGTTGDNQTTEAGKWFATELKEGNFYVEQGNSPGYSDEDVTDAEKAEAVDVFVERLAAKVTVNTPQNAPTIQLGTIELDGEDTEVTLVVNGWKLNGTEKQEYLMKNINDKWTFGTDIWDVNWNNTNDHRSYWAKSVHYNYVEENYPNSFVNANGNYTGDNADVNSYVLNYFSWNDVKNTIGNSEYCRENTLSVDHLERNLQGSATSVLVAATLKIGNEAKTVFRRGPVFFTEENLKETIMEENQTKLNAIKTLKVGTTNEYRSVEVTDVELVSLGDGYMTIAFTKEAAKLTWGTISDDTFTAFGENDDPLAEVNKELNKIEGFNEGKMYYNIPIEHLANFNEDGNDKKIKYNHKDYSTNAKEGQYGVVRNHWYNITINSIKSIGKGVYNPDEDIIPNKDEATLYYLAAEVNVLSWHTVNQDVDL